jgi:hypothetical protein
MVLDLGFHDFGLGGLVVLADQATEYLPPPDWQVQQACAGFGQEG